VIIMASSFSFLSMYVVVVFFWCLDVDDACDE